MGWFDFIKSHYISYGIYPDGSDSAAFFNTVRYVEEDDTTKIGMPKPSALIKMMQNDSVEKTGVDIEE